MASENENNPWMKVNFPSKEFEEYGYTRSNIVAINEEELIIAPQGGIYKYNIFDNEWKLFVKYPTVLQEECKLYPFQIAFDSKENVLCLGSAHYLVKVNMNSKEFTTKRCSVGQDGFSPIVIDSTYHVVQVGYSHKIYNDKHKDTDTDETKTKWFRNNIFLLSGGDSIFYKNQMNKYGVVYVASQNGLYLFGGQDLGPEYNGDDGYVVDTIYRYKLDTKKWEKLNQRLPEPIGCMGTAITSDDRYIFLIGGNTDDKTPINKIYIVDMLDLNQIKFTLSKIKTPDTNHCYGQSHAVIISNRSKINMLINGYIRLENKSKFKVNHDILKLIVRFYGIYEYIHLICSDKHWKISIDAFQKELQ
eukprot:34288_1